MEWWINSGGHKHPLLAVDSTDAIHQNDLMIVSQRGPKQAIDEKSILEKPSDSPSTLPSHFSLASVRFFFSKIRGNFVTGKER